MIGGLLGGLMGGMGGGIGSRLLGARGSSLFGARAMGARRPLQDLVDGNERTIGRQSSQKIPQPTIGKTGPVEAPQLPATQLEQATASKPEPMPTMGPADRPIEPQKIGSQEQQQAQQLSRPAEQQSPTQQPQQQQPLQGLLEPPKQEPAQAPAMQDAQPMDVTAVDPTQGIQPQEIETQVQTLPPSRYTPIQNAWPSQPARAPSGANDPIPSPDLGFGFNRPEGVEDYAAKFTYRRR